MPRPVLHVMIASTRPGRIGPAVARWFKQLADRLEGFPGREKNHPHRPGKGEAAGGVVPVHYSSSPALRQAFGQNLCSFFRPSPLPAFCGESGFSCGPDSAWQDCTFHGFPSCYADGVTVRAWT